MSSRASVQDIVRVIVSRNPYIYRGLRMRVVNYSALARYIQEDVEGLIGDEVDPNTIVTAIMRLSNQIFEPQEVNSPFYASRLNLITGISEVLIKAPPVKHSEIIKKIVDLKVFDSYMTSLRQSSTGIKIFTNSPDADKVRDELRYYTVDIKERYAQIVIRLPSDLDGLEGALTIVVDALAQNGVHAIDTNISENEISLVLKEDNAGHAFEALRALMR
ncbi:hypothetical protein JW865_00415 [Candidatus Bathyarchaeota archaeon]|nr:hypothetical protein [Candidatus Bathyarchaeota archaeon]